MQALSRPHRAAGCVRLKARPMMPFPDLSYPNSNTEAGNQVVEPKETPI